MTLLILVACGHSPDSADNKAEVSADTGQLARHGHSWPLAFAFYDADGDGYGDPTDRHRSAWLPHNYSWLAGDCDDADAAVNPGAEELPDGLDNDCDGVVDMPADTGGGDTAGSDTADTAADSGGDTSTPADTGDSTVDTASGDTAVPDTGTATVTGIVVSRDTTGGLTYPATLWAWYGSGGTASQSVASASEQLVFSPATADLSDHSWVDIQAEWSSGASWSDDCDGFAVSSPDYTVALYAHTVGGSSGDTCRIYVGLAVPSGGDVGNWTAVP